MAPHVRLTTVVIGTVSYRSLINQIVRILMPKLKSNSVDKEYT